MPKVTEPVNGSVLRAASDSKEHSGKVAFIEEDMNFYFGGFMMFKNYKIPLPPLEKQTEIANHNSTIRAQAKALQQQAQAELGQAKQHVELIILGETP